MDVVKKEIRFIAERKEDAEDRVRLCICGGKGSEQLGGKHVSSILWEKLVKGSQRCKCCHVSVFSSFQKCIIIQTEHSHRRVCDLPGEDGHRPPITLHVRRWSCCAKNMADTETRISENLLSSAKVNDQVLSLKKFDHKLSAKRIIHS